MSRNTLIPGFDYRPDREPGSGGGHAIQWTRAQWREFGERPGVVVTRFKDGAGHTTNYHQRINGRPDLAAEAYTP